APDGAPGEAAAVGEADAAGEAAGADPGLDAVGTSESGTNVQEAGVDEPARLKTDGEHVLTVSGGELIVVRVTGPGPTVVGRVALAPGDADAPPGGGALAVDPVSELLLAGDRVVVLGQGWSGGVVPGVPLPVPIEPGIGDSTTAGSAAADTSYPAPIGSPTTTVTVVDVSDPGNPAVVARDEVEGGYLSARATGAGEDATVRLVLASTPVLPLLTPGAVPRPGGDPLDEAGAAAHNREVVAGLPAEQWLPRRIVDSEPGDPVVACDQVSHPAEGAGIGTVTVLTLDPAVAPGAGPEALVVDADAVTADGENVYASADRLYVATTAGGWWSPRGGETRTELHGFAVSDAGTTSYLGSGAVPGWLLGRWALSARDGHLRVATTTDPAPDGAGTAMQSSVHVLAETGDGLRQVGRVDGLGPGESIRAVRWFGDLAVVVTFRQTDPLYTVDLSDPAAPAVTGELKVTGYSAYLHPVGGERLLGIGQEATLEGVQLGTKAETYDLSDLAAPAAVDSLVWPQSASPVEWDSRQFSYLPERSVALFGIDGMGPVEPTTRTPGAEPGTARPAPPTGPGLVSVAVGNDGTLAEAGRWTAGDSASTVDGFVPWVGVTGHVVAGDTVAVTTEEFGADGGPRTRLVLLAVDGLREEGAVDLRGEAG
ncbi:MAG: beta-propeller domain-containing protein, partial [Actinomycetales bacterium]